MEENNKDKILHIPVDDIIPNRFQPRLAFNENELNELSASISKYGVIQPIVLRNIGEKYEIIAGERRYKATCLAGLKTIPAIINNTDDNTSAEIALLENLQRKNLTPIEEAQSYRKLMDRGFTQEEIAIKLGISQSAIANKLRLLNLPKKVQDALLYNKISERHARSLLTLNDKDLQINLLERIISERLTVKQTEEEIDKLLNKAKNENDIPDEIQKYINGNRVEMNFNINSDQDNNSTKSSYESEQLDRLLESKKATAIKENPFEIKVPEVVNIDENFEEKLNIKGYLENNDINPFQKDNKNVYDRLSQNFKEINFEENINKTDEFKNENLDTEDREDIKKDSKKESIPKIINSIREYISELEGINKVIKTQEKDLDNKYQIIIEIDKDLDE